MCKVSFLNLISLVCFLVAPTAYAQAQTPTMPPAQFKSLLESVESSWIAFREFDGKQLIYFTTLMTYHCQIKEIRYGLNGEQPTKIYPLPKCIPGAPFQIDATKNTVYLENAIGLIKSISVQVTFEDGTHSKIVQYTPCEDKLATCAVRKN